MTEHNHNALFNLSLAFLADFTVSDSAVIRFIAFPRKLKSAFHLDQKI